jgi:excisionase family DNA binding protein
MTEDDKPEGKSLTVEEVAERLNAHPSTVRELLNSGKLKGFQLVRQWRVTPEELEKFMNQGVSQ